MNRMAFSYFRSNAVAVVLALLVNASTSATDLVAFMSSSIPNLLTDVPGFSFPQTFYP
jgi:hypothetical protein